MTKLYLELDNCFMLKNVMRSAYVLKTYKYSYRFVYLEQVWVRLTQFVCVMSFESMSFFSY